MTTVKREKLASLEQQKARISTELDELKRQRAEARVNDREFDGGDRIAAITAELGEIDEALALAQKYADEEERQEIATLQLTVNRRRLATMQQLQESYLSRINGIQKATAEMATGLAAAYADLAQLSGYLAALPETPGKNTGMDFQPLAPGIFETRISAKMAAQLSDHLSMFKPSLPSPGDIASWAAEWEADERRLVEGLLHLTRRHFEAQVEELEAVTKG